MKLYFITKECFCLFLFTGTVMFFESMRLPWISVYENALNTDFLKINTQPVHMHRKQLHRKPYLISLLLSATVSIVLLLNDLYWTLSIFNKDKEDKVSFTCMFTKISSFFLTHKTIYLLSLIVPSFCNPHMPQSNKQNNYLSFFMELSILQKKL